MTMTTLPLNKIQTASPGLGDAGQLSVWKPTADERILIFAPHPDDESLAAGGVIASMWQDRPESQIRVIIATNGDASYTTALFHGSHTFTKRHFQSIAIARQQESLTALTILGLYESQICFWGFPDRGLLQLRQKYWGREAAYRSPATGFCRAEQAINSPPLQYNGMNLLRLIQDELRTFRPTTIIFPHPQDAHPDHQTLAFLTLFAAGTQYARRTFPQMLAYRMWSGNKFWMTGAHAGKNAKATLSQNAPQGEWKLFPLSKSVREQKAIALGCYRSQDFAAGQLLENSAKNEQEIFALFSPALRYKKTDQKQ